MTPTGFEPVKKWHSEHAAGVGIHIGIHEETATGAAAASKQRGPGLCPLLLEVINTWPSLTPADQVAVLAITRAKRKEATHEH